MRTHHMPKPFTDGTRVFHGVTPSASMRRVLYGLLALLAVTFASKPATAQDETSQIDAVFSWATQATPGCAVAVSQNGERVIDRAYGSADLERNIPLTPSTVFDAGSLVKQFVAAAVLLLVEDGRLSLTDDVREYIPELPEYGHTITVDHLLTHTSGVRDWTGLQMLSSSGETALTLVLRQRGLNFDPGEEWSYSNSGYVLLKELIARVTGRPFSEFARGRLFEPLGMAATTYAEEVRESPEGLALAYEKDGDLWKQDVLVGNERGGGGALLSTAGDLLIWNEALTAARLGTFVTEKLQEPARLNNGREIGYGRGLFLDTNRGGRVVWHTGSAGGYKSFLSRYPEQGLSIAILCNAGDSADRGMFARRIYDLFVPATNAPEAEADAPAAGTDVEGVDVTSRAGLFFSEATGEPLRLVVNDGRLRVAGGPPLVTMSEGRFRNPSGALSFMSQDEFELHFLSPDAFDLISMEGEPTRYRRARPYAPTKAELEELAGRWESDELEAVFEIAPGDQGLMIRLNGAPAEGIEFAPVDTDTFQRGRMTLRFRRNEDGRVAALDYSNPVLRDVPFVRRSDGANDR